MERAIGTASRPHGHTATLGETSFAIFLLPHFSMVAFASIIEPLRLANRVSGKSIYNWVLVSSDGAPIQASNGVEFQVHHSIEDIHFTDNIVMCGGIDGQRFEDPAVFAWLRRSAVRGAHLGATCTGSFALARAGVLNGHRCTVHWEHLASLTETFPNLEVTGELFSIDRKRFTCAGGAASADMMLNLIAEVHGQAIAAEVSEQMLHDKIRPGTTRQSSVVQLPVGSDREDLRAAIALMHELIETPVDLETLARRLGTSRRSLERLFRKFMACSPAKYYLGLRLVRARQLLHQTSMPVVEVALCCGFSSATHFSRCYRDRYGMPPKADRFQGLVGVQNEARKALSV